MDSYINRVVNKTPTRFWANNPMPKVAAQALELYGVYGVTTNPQYVGVVLKNDKNMVYEFLDSLIAVESDNEAVMEKLYATLVREVALEYLPTFKKSNGKKGFVAIQGSPLHDRDEDYTIAEARRLAAIAPNLIIKVQGHSVGLKAFKKLTAMNMNLIMTGGFSVSQMDLFANAYREVHGNTKNGPMLYYTFLTGIYDQYTEAYMKENNIDIAPEVLAEAGCNATRLIYKKWVDAAYPGKILSGGPRNPRHIYNVLGGETEIAMNYPASFDELNALNPPISDTINSFAKKETVDILLNKIPYYKITLGEDGVQSEEFDTYYPTESLRRVFTNAWNATLEEIAMRRDILSK